MRSNLELVTASSRIGGCGCGCSGEETPELEVTSLPKIIRHGAVIGGLTSMKSGQRLILVAPHDPRPLLTQLSRVAPDAFGIEYLQEGPQDWRIEVTRH